MKNIDGTVNWGIIGCGDVCEVKSGPAFSKVPNSNLVAVMRRNANKAKDFALRHGVPGYYTDAAALVNDKDVNAIYIATPPSSHEEYTAMALKAGKPVYVEKPVTINSASVERMMELEKQFDGKVSVAHYRRGLPLFKKVKQLVKDGAIGKPKIVLLKTLQHFVNNVIPKTGEYWRINPGISGGGLFHDISPHQLDIMYWIFGKPQQVQVLSANQGQHYNIPDHTMVQMRFGNDICFTGTWNFNVAENAAADNCEIIGDKGKISFSFFRVSNIELTTSSGLQIVEQEYPVNIQQPFIDKVVKFFRGEDENPCSLEDALVTMRILDKAS